MARTRKGTNSNSNTIYKNADKDGPGFSALDVYVGPTTLPTGAVVRFRSSEGGVWSKPVVLNTTQRKHLAEFLLRGLKDEVSPPSLIEEY